MRKQTELRTVTNRENSRRTGEKTNVVDVKREGEGLTTSLSPTITLEKNLRSTINEMERWFEESFHRPFLGLNWLPVRNLFNDIGITGDITPEYLNRIEQARGNKIKAQDAEEDQLELDLVMSATSM